MPNLIRKPLTRGMTIISGIEDTTLGGLSMGLISLKKDDRFGETLNSREAIVVLLHGRAKIRGEGFDYGEVSARETVFDGAPVAFYCPPGMYSIKAKSNCALAVFRYELEKKNKGAAPMLIRPIQIEDSATGSGETRITRRTICDLSASVSGLRVGEAVFGPSASGLPTELLSQVSSGKSGALLFLAFDDGIGEGTLRIDNEEFPLEDNDTMIIMPGEKISGFTPANKSAFCLWAVANSR